VATRYGNIGILNPGLHFLEAPDTFRTFVSIQQEHFQFGSHTTKSYFLTADNVALDVEATLFYRISDVQTAFTTSFSDVNDLVETLRSQATSILMSIIRSENFSNIGKEKSLTGTGDQMSEPQEQGYNNVVNIQASAPYPHNPQHSMSAGNHANIPVAQSVASNVSMGFQSIIHDAEPLFLKNMQRFSNRYGFEVESLRIEKIEFADKSLQKSVSEFAVTYTKLAAQEATIAAERKVELAQAEREAAKLEIQANADNERKLKAAQNEADAKQIAAKSTAQLLSVTAESEANALKVKGQAEAQVILMKAEAEAAGLKAMGEAEAAVLERKGQFPNAALSMIVDGQVKALHGVEKVIYCSTDSQMLLQQTSAIASAFSGNSKH
jgi:regulator of protease activity HflC (stomatin/prohibitin superfamily)